MLDKFKLFQPLVELRITPKAETIIQQLRIRTKREYLRGVPRTICIVEGVVEVGLIGVDLDDRRSSLVSLLSPFTVDYELDMLVSKGSDVKNNLPSELLLFH